MRWFRFDPSTGRQIEQFGSDAVMSPLTTPDGGTAKTACLHLPAGGGLGRHEATVTQLFAVARGRGWVTGTDGIRHVIDADEAVMWEAGEWHESGTDDGMTAIVIEGSFTPIGTALDRPDGHRVR